MEQKAQQHILGCRLELTCGAYPEQYDVFIGHRQVGYLRLRGGRFRADYPDVMEETVYTAEPQGEGYFFDDEREFFLTHAVSALVVRDSQEPNAGPPL